MRFSFIFPMSNRDLVFVQLGLYSRRSEYLGVPYAVCKQISNGMQNWNAVGFWSGPDVRRMRSGGHGALDG